MNDVAREAGVSVGTVSRCINGIPVKDASRRRVEAAIQKLNYRVNNYARGFKTNKTYCVALILPSLGIPFFSLLAEEVTAALNKRGYRMVLMVTNYDSEAEATSVSLVRQNKMDGIIALTYNPNIDFDASVPVVSIDRHCGESTTCVSSDNFRGGQLAAEGLIARGCRKLLFMRIGSDVASEVDKRAIGFESACRARGVAYEMLIVNDEATTLPLFRYLEEHTHAGVPDFDGIFCNTDRLALQMQHKLTELGVRVPEDVQLVGFDGVNDYVFGCPPCSTIVQPVAQLAETAVETLFVKDSAAVPSLICLPVRFEAHGTTKEA
ncbi:MAG: LacI family DNA-binding transcriptional regulator [Oscillospiraceae bacterium]|nr:LacI family DNA-binding transcriptional regulator [Oscillospiraceae bacterium]